MIDSIRRACIHVECRLFFEVKAKVFTHALKAM